MDMCLCKIGNTTWATHQESEEKKNYLLQKLFKKEPMIFRRGKWFKVYHYCKIGNSYWGYIRPDAEEQAEQQRIIYHNEEYTESITIDTTHF